MNDFLPVKNDLEEEKKESFENKEENKEPVKEEKSFLIKK